MSAEGGRTLEARVQILEATLRRARRIALGLGTLAVLMALVAWRAQDRLETGTLVLTGLAGQPGVVLRAGPAEEGASLVLETPEGTQVMRLGGQAARFAPRR